MESLISFLRLRNTGLVHAGIYRIGIKVSIPEIPDDQIVLAVYHKGSTSTSLSSSNTSDNNKLSSSSPVKYSVRGRVVGEKQIRQGSDVVDDKDDGMIYCTPFQVDYEEEDVEVNESALIHCSLSILDLQSSSSARLTVVLEIKAKRDNKDKPTSNGTGEVGDTSTGFFFKRIETQIFELTGDRYGLNEAAVVFFNDNDYGSATLDLLILSCTQTLIGGANLAESLFPSQIDKLDDELSEQDTIRATRTITKHLAPCKSSLALLESIANSHMLSPRIAPTSTSSDVRNSEPHENTKQDDASLEARSTIRYLCKLAEDVEAQEGPRRVILWHSTVKRCKSTVVEFSEPAKQRWKQRARDVVGELFIREKLPKASLTVPQDHLLRGKDCRAIADKLRTAPRFSEWDLASRPMTGPKTFVDHAGRPVVFEQRFETPLSSSVSTNTCSIEDGIHLVVLLHGFLGSKWDLRVFSLVLASLDIPGIRLKAIETNENHTEWPIEVSLR
jgi:hypothetical protein